MDEKNLKRLSYLVTASGIIMMSLIIILYQPEPVNLIGFKSSGLESRLHIVGSIDRISSFGNLTILSIRPYEKIDAVIFDDIDGRIIDAFNLKEGDLLDITGEKTEFKDEEQIKVETFSKISSVS